MAVPDFETLMLPLLREVAKGETTVKSVIPAIAAEFRLSAADLEERIPSRRMTVIASRLHWARFYLLKAGLVDAPRRAVIRATERGRSVLRTPPPRIDHAFLRQYSEFQAFERQSRRAPEAPSGEGPTPAPPRTPEEEIDAASAVVTASLRDELLRRLVRATPSFFEQVIVDLLVAMGYGGSRTGAGKTVGRTGDNGIDGVINEDPLGLDVVYLQAKRYDPEKPVTEEHVRGFSGALVGRGAAKGVFVTTSYFTEPARDFARTVRHQRLVLIDGSELADLCVRHGVGVRTDRTVEIRAIDLDYFEEEVTLPRDSS